MGQFIDDLYENIFNELELTIEANKPELTIENTGIGAYEFWGAKGFDKGQDYLVAPEETETFVFGPYNETTAVKLVDYIEDCDVYESYVNVDVDGKYDSTTHQVNFKVESVKIVNHCIEIEIQYGEVE